MNGNVLEDDISLFLVHIWLSWIIEMGVKLFKEFFTCIKFSFPHFLKESCRFRPWEKKNCLILYTRLWKLRMSAKDMLTIGKRFLKFMKNLVRSFDFLKIGVQNFPIILFLLWFHAVEHLNIVQLKRKVCLPSIRSWAVWRVYRHSSRITL